MVSAFISNGVKENILIGDKEILKRNQPKMYKKRL